jgi:hypothetical protein
MFIEASRAATLRYEQISSYRYCYVYSNDFDLDPLLFKASDAGP